MSDEISENGKSIVLKIEDTKEQREKVNIEDGPFSAGQFNRSDKNNFDNGGI